MLQKRLNLIFFQPYFLMRSVKFCQYSILRQFKNWQNLLVSQSLYFKSKYPAIFTFFNLSLNEPKSDFHFTNFSNFTYMRPKQLFFYRYYYNGLGYKVFFKNDYLFVWVGLTHYTLLRVPTYIKIFAKKRRFFIIGTNRLKFNSFLAQIRNIRKIDLYKGKGLTEFRSYKGFVKMKSGKKKQY